MELSVSRHKRTTFWTSDWFTGVVYTIAFLVVALIVARASFHSLESAVYDRAIGLKSAAADPRVVVVAIDEQSIRNIGRFPFSRDVIAETIDQLARGGAKVIASSIAFPEAQIDPGVDYLRELDRFVNESTLTQPTLAERPELASDVAALRTQIRSAIDSIAYDERLATSIESAGNVILPLQFRSVGTPAGRPDALTAPFIGQHQIANPQRVGGAVPFGDMSAPIPELGSHAAALGHLSVLLDEDGAVRFEPLIANYFGELYPSLALITAATALNLSAADINLTDTPSGVTLGALQFPTDNHFRFYPHFYSPRDGAPAFRVESFYAIFSGQIPLESFRDKVVLIGATATGVGDSLRTPVGASTAPVMVLAHTVSSLLQQHYVTRPAFAVPLEWAIFAALFVYVVLVIPRLRAGTAAFISAALAAALLGGEIQLLSGSSMWLQLATPLAFLLVGHLIMTVKRFGMTERLKSQSDVAGAQSNRMLGLAFQGQGQLDLAFEKFRQCPLDDELMEPLYNLALDYERKRQFNKAGVVYEIMSQHAPDYKDLAQRLKRSKVMDETLVLGGSHGGANPSLMLDGDGVQKPMLGRYTVEKEIGKGAMGTVYLGRDPKINRVVAIKTIAISQEFDEDEVASVRERFFREAETAGRLNHPDIVTVYDAGEEHDLAYIAMEFLKGHHLSAHTRSEQLLPEELVITMMARVADALAYAHKEDVVHRDIKPANIMYDPESGDLKITDFGIARITSSSKTKTGIVLGTPSYMSPEQLAGKNVTGRSDLFSLGVTLYQLLTGQLPFRADSMATLMFKIANEPHTPLRAARPELPACLEQVMDRALDKDADARYQSGAEMAIDLRECQAFLAA